MYAYNLTHKCYIILKLTRNTLAYYGRATKGVKKFYGIGYWMFFDDVKAAHSHIHEIYGVDKPYWAHSRSQSYVIKKFTAAIYKSL